MRTNDLNKTMWPDFSDDDFLRRMTFLVTRTLVKRGRLTREHLSDPAGLAELFLGNLKYATRRAEWSISHEDELLDESERLWKEGSKALAIFLFATAIEHSVNGFYRQILEFKGFSRKEVTQVIRTSSIEAKLTWLLKLSTGRTLPRGTRRRVKQVFEIRNAFGHFKYVPSLIGEDSDTSSKIDKMIKALGRISLRRNFAILNERLWDISTATDDGLAVAAEAVHILDDYRQGLEKPANKELKATHKSAP